MDVCKCGTSLTVEGERETSTVIKSCEHKNNGLSVFIAEEAGNAAEKHHKLQFGAEVKLGLILQMALL